jgi:branched-chain amino acid transport system ATP-binding protein
MTSLSATGLRAGYGLLTAVRDVSLHAASGTVVALVGANGAGKTTLLRSLAGAQPLRAGQVRLGEDDVTHLPAHRRCRRGLALVPEGRRLFPELTVRENLAVAASIRRPGPWSIDASIEAFPQLKDILDRPASRLSGGQQQAVAIARALVTNPEVLMIDEVSLGLSPTAVDGVYASLARLRRTGVTVLLVEQDLKRAFAFADTLICMLEGRVVLEGTPASLTRAQVTDAYFGLHSSAVSPDQTQREHP